MQLPANNKVDITKLSSCFRNTSATYKFYWFLSILEIVEKNKRQIPKKEIFARMMANAWYTVNYFQVSFGSQDKIQETILNLNSLESISIESKKNEIIDRLVNSSSTKTGRHLLHFDKQVPHYFLSPWIGSKGSKNQLSAISRSGLNNPPYELYDDHIIVQTDWFEYFKKNSRILKDFCYWNLTLYLQSRNPNVPDIPNKLKRPEKRGSLSKHKSNFWDIVINELDGINCIYTGKKLNKGEYAVEHFVPFQFVAHDQMWNLIPADPSFNSSKGSKLPNMDKYFDNFYSIQIEAVNIIKTKKPKNKFLEDYYIVFKSLDLSKEQYLDCVEPLITIANNNGFQFMN